MQLGKGGKGLPEDKKQLAMGGAAVLMILIAGFLFYRNLSGGGGDFIPYKPGNPTASASAPSGKRAPAQPDAGSASSAAAPPPSAQQAAPAQPAPSAARVVVRPAAPPSRPSPGRVAAATTDKSGMRQLTVFGSVSVSYPQAWKIKAGAGNLSAIFTDGRASFEVLQPDPRATTAKAIAESAVRQLARGAVVTAGGSAKIGGYDAYWIAVRVGGKMAQIVGVDASTRVVLFERVAGGDFAAYKGTFDNMEAGTKFGK